MSTFDYNIGPRTSNIFAILAKKTEKKKEEEIELKSKKGTFLQRLKYNLTKTTKPSETESTYYLFLQDDQPQKLELTPKRNKDNFLMITNKNNNTEPKENNDKIEPLIWRGKISSMISLQETNSTLPSPQIVLNNKNSISLQLNVSLYMTSPHLRSRHTYKEKKNFNFFKATREDMIHEYVISYPIHNISYGDVRTHNFTVNSKIERRLKLIKVP